MSFSYINPGYAELFTTPGNYTPSTDANYTKTGVAFENGDAAPAILTLPDLDNLWVKFDFYHGWKAQLTACLNGNKSIGINAGDEDHFSFYSNTYTLIKPEINHILMHFDAKNNTADMWFNGVKGTTVTDAGLSGQKISSITFIISQWAAQYADRCNNWMSNIIISDSEIELAENVRIISAADTTTDMTKNSDGSYTSTAVGQSVMQKMDLSSFPTSKIKRVQLTSRPAYFSGESMTKMDCIMKKADTAEIKETVQLTTSTRGMCMVAWEENKDANYFSDVSLGWKTEA